MERLSRAISVILVAPKKFALSNTTKGGSMFQEPMYGIFAGFPIDRNNQYQREAVLLLQQICLSMRQERDSIDPVLLDHQLLLAIDPKRPLLVA
jgi:hypothetical protein